MEVEVIENTWKERAYGEYHERTTTEGLKVTDGGRTVTLDSRTKGTFRHEHGFLLTVDASVYSIDSTITVETAYESYEEGWEYQQWNFDSVAKLEAWLSKHASLVQ